MKKRAIVLFNLGGPDSLKAVRPFLFNLFNDPAIIGAPTPIRWALAQFISRRRAPVAQEIYRHLGGKSPLLEQTQAQADALQAVLNSRQPEITSKVFLAMRYWHPMTAQTMGEVKTFAPDEVVLLPLYPQYSSTTSGSSLALWAKEAAKQGVTTPTRTIACWPTENGFIEAMAQSVSAAVSQAATMGSPRVLFSAHGLPKKIVAGGDPYQWQVEQTAAAIAEKMALPGLDWLVSYQSRVGPLEWIGPATDHEIERAGADGVPLVVVPLAFVSEHSETLVELDIEYRELAEKAGVKGYFRIPTVQTAVPFIAGLADLVEQAAHQPCDPTSACGKRICPAEFGLCPCKSPA
jgi:ferrochelatase